MNLRWTVNRLRAMGVREVAQRAQRYVHTQLERTGVGLASPPPVVGGARGRPWVADFPHLVPSEPYREAAECILAGRFRLFGSREWELGLPPAWNRDPKTGTLAPSTFGKTLNYRDATLVGDIKYLWEPNRHLELVTLAQAWRLTADPRYADGCRTLLQSWLAQCPYPLGPNWTSSLEVALRLVNWSCAWHLLGGEDSALFADEAGRAFRGAWLDAVYRHCYFIAGYLSFQSSANNHLLGELLGLLIGALTWPCWPQSCDWRGQAREEFERQALLQNAVDGVNREQAVWYQHEVTDMMVLAGLSARANGCDFAPAYWQRLEAMMAFLASCMDAGGELPAFGDSDDGVIVRFSPIETVSPYRSLLATGSVLFERADFRHKAQAFDDKSRWLLGDAAAERFQRIEPDASETRLPRAFPEGGYYILGSDFGTAREVRVVVDAGSLGYLSLAAHGHADALSLTLSVGGQPILIDPGTYCYHTQRPWREYFRGTSAHNTVRIDGLDQSVSGGNFLWLRHAQARCLLFEPQGDEQRFEAEHDGYLRLADPVQHRRRITYEPVMRQLTVLDALLCRAAHRIEFFWHFDEDCTVRLASARAHVSHARAELTLQWPAGLAARVIRADEESHLGWRSRRFGEKVPCSTLHVSGTLNGCWQGSTVICLVA
jgi:hypothetical protein